MKKPKDKLSKALLHVFEERADEELRRSCQELADYLAEHPGDEWDGDDYKEKPRSTLQIVKDANPPGDWEDLAEMLVGTINEYLATHSGLSADNVRLAITCLQKAFDEANPSNKASDAPVKPSTFAASPEAQARAVSPERRAHHEAAHCVIAARYGLKVTVGGITIIPDSVRLGNSHLETPVIRPDSAYASIEGELRYRQLGERNFYAEADNCVNLAGPVAEAYYMELNGISGWEFNQKNGKCKLPGWDGDVPRIEATMRTLEGPGDKSLDVHHLRAKVLPMVKEPRTWKAIEALAALVLEKQHVEKDEANDFLKAQDFPRLSGVSKAREITRLAGLCKAREIELASKGNDR